MKIPESIKVGGSTYKIYFDEHLWHNEGVRGQVDYTNQIIKLDTYGHPELIAETFLHEMTHVIDKHLNNKSLTEDEIDIIAEGLFQVLGDLGITFER